MSYYGVWGRPKEKEPRSFFEKAYRRQPLPAWDARWAQLSPPARRAFLDDVKGPVRRSVANAAQPAVSKEKFPAKVLKELTDAGFVAVGGARPDRVSAVEDVYDFATRVRALRRYHLLAPGPPETFRKYVDFAFYNGEVARIAMEVLRKAGIEHYGFDDALLRYLTLHYWPGWVAAYLKDPVADRILAALREADGPVPLAELPGRLKGVDAEAVRPALDRLVGHLALVEDLHPQTYELMVGYLPAVREDLERAGRPRARPPLIVCEAPKEEGPEGGPLVDDLRAFLLEVAGDPPRLKQDGDLFAKELERFREALGPLPAWLTAALGWSPDSRIEQALGWSRVLKLVKVVGQEKQTRLQLSPKGHAWLASPLADQYRGIIDVLRAPPPKDDYSADETIFYPRIPYFQDYGHGDLRFLGVNVTAVKAGRRRSPYSTYYWEIKPEDRDLLRQALDRSLGELPAGKFVRLDSALDHLAFGGHNPLALGLSHEQVSVFRENRPVPALDEPREQAGRELLDAFIRRKLIPVGALAAAVDDEGRLCVARTPRLDAYFGRAVAAADLAGAPAEGGSRVVVQPDFSVVVIGVSPAPAAELAPFCERTTRGGSRGAQVLKLTRESVVKAVGHGMAPAEILGRLDRLSSNAVPANVRKEVEGWGRWVRRVKAETLSVLRCPDREAADRILGVLKGRAERVNDTMVAVEPRTLTPAERTRLRDQGVILESGDDPEPRPKAKKPKRRRW